MGSGLRGSCTAALMARLLLAGLLALVLLTVADEEDGQVVVQDGTGQAILGRDTKAHERHQRSADPGKKSIRGVKKVNDKGPKNRKSSKGKVNKKGKRNNRNGSKGKNKAKKVNGKNKKKKGRKNNKDKKHRVNKGVKQKTKIQKKRKIGRRIQKRKEMK